MKRLNQLSLFQQIFLTVLLVLSLTSIAFVITAISQSSKAVTEYNKIRLFRKEGRIRTSIDYAISLHKDYINQYNLVEVLTPKMYELKDIEGVETRLYDLRGKLLFDVNKLLLEKTSKKNFAIKKSVLSKILKIPFGQNLLVIHSRKNRSSFSYVRNAKNEKVGIIEIPYIDDNSFLKRERNNIIGNIIFIFFIVFIFALGLIYIFSKNISDRVKSIAEKIKETDITSTLNTIEYQGKDELQDIVKSYNKMVVRLKKSTHALAKIEREEAWKRMARQVAHEIKNPLTPMSLSIQSFQRRFDVNDPKATEKMNNLCNSLLQQINTLSNITNAFADFAKMPTRKDEEFNLVLCIKNSLEIFDNKRIEFIHNKDYIAFKMDKSQLDRVMNNLIKNAFQAVPSDRKPHIIVKVTQLVKEITITIKDNGIGIPASLQKKIFEPKFTTKNSGMGLGLAIVKKILSDYDATIILSSTPGKGSTFTIKKTI